MPTQQPHPLSAAQVAERLGVTRRTVARLYLRGEFPNAYRLGDHPTAPLAIPEKDVIAYEKKLAQAPSGAQAS